MQKTSLGWLISPSDFDCRPRLKLRNRYLYTGNTLRMTNIRKTNPQNNLQKSREAFHKLLALIDKKRKELARYRTRIETGKKVYAERIAPLHTGYAQLQRAYASSLWDWLENPNLSLPEAEKLELVISHAIEEGLAFAPNDPGLSDLMAKLDHRRKSGCTMKKPATHFRQPENNKKHGGGTHPNGKMADMPELKRTTKQLFTDLAKKLHPDLERNEQLQSEKTELMKQVTEAYDQQDLFGLLHLHQRHINDERLLGPGQPDGDKLQRYATMLKKQAADLQRQIDDMKNGASTRFLFHLTSGTELEQQQKLEYISLQLSARNARLRNEIASTMADIKTFKKHLKSINPDNPVR
ncbi:MAG: J domain-containing protein [Breznakibacter sp.]